MTPRTVFLHVGLHKTATTLLQRVVFPAMDGVSLVTRPYTQHNRAFNRLQYADDTLWDETSVRAEIDRLPAGTVLLSDEGFSGKVLYFNYVNRSMIARRLARLFPDATVLLFLRGQADIVASHYNQYVREGGTLAFGEFVWRGDRDFPAGPVEDPADWRFDPRTLDFNTNGCRLHLDDFLYRGLIDLYDALFPRVEVLLHEDLAADPEGVLDRLESILGSRIGPAAREAVAASRENPSVGPDALDRIRRGNRAAAATANPRARRLVEAILRLWPEPGEPGDAPGPDVAAHYRDDNRRVVEAYPEIGLDRHPDRYAL